MYCLNCGSFVSDNANFCSVCGAKQNYSTDVAAFSNNNGSNWVISSNNETTEVQSMNCCLVKELHFSVYVPTNLPRNSDGKINYLSSDSQYVANKVNDAIRAIIYDAQKQARKRCHNFYEYDMYKDKITPLDHDYLVIHWRIKIQKPATVDDEGDAWFYVDIEFEEEIDKNNMPEELMRDIVYEIEYSYNVYKYWLNSSNGFSSKEWFLLDVNFEKLRENNYEFFKALVERSN